MQRTVKSTKFTFARVTLNEKNEIETNLDTITVMEIDPKKALKKAFKEVGTFAPIKTEICEDLYVLDDDVFFKYAKKVEPKEK